jgi:type II restriction enzyme
MSQSALAEKAVQDALHYGRALLKFISANNVGLTGSHEYGYYLPVTAWKLYADHPPKKGINTDKPVKINWQNGARITDSVVKWYGAKTRYEFRLTSFGKGFPYRSPGNVGDMLVLVRTGNETFNAYVLNSPDDIEHMQAALGTEIIDKAWGVYPSAPMAEKETTHDCIYRYFQSFIGKIEVFPPSIEFSGTTLTAVLNCIRDFKNLSRDKQLALLLDREYDLFRMAEGLLCREDVSRHYKTIDQFLAAASSILNRRKSRAGKSLEHHVEYLVRSAGIQFDAHAKVDGEPDFLIPGKQAYQDKAWPEEKLFTVGLKTTCKDRWRQILNEAKRVKKKHLLTIQQGVSAGQLTEMREAGVTLVVPEHLHKLYPVVRDMKILSLEDLITDIKTQFPGGAGKISGIC